MTEHESDALRAARRAATVITAMRTNDRQTLLATAKEAVQEGPQPAILLISALAIMGSQAALLLDGLNGPDVGNTWIRESALKVERDALGGDA